LAGGHVVRLMESGDVFGHAAAVRCIFECDVGEQHKCECLILDPVLRALPSVGRGGKEGGYHHACQLWHV